MEIDIKKITPEEVNDFSNFCVYYFNAIGFKQIFLNSSVDYFIHSTKYIALPNKKYLRCNTEPDIWEKSRGANAFFAITSLFRIEDDTSKLHKQEFKIVDYYVQNADFTTIYNHIFSIFDLYEKQNGLPKFSSLRKTVINYVDFNNNAYDRSFPQICVVNGYPIEETFYDDVDDSGSPLKTELFFTFNDISIEFAVLGKVGKNLNQINFIDNYDFVDNNVNLWGGGIGIERVLLCYKAFQLCNWFQDPQKNGC